MVRTCAGQLVPPDVPIPVTLATHRCHHRLLQSSSSSMRDTGRPDGRASTNVLHLRSMVTVMTTTHSDLARERFSAEVAAASDEALRSLAYAYVGLAALQSNRTTSAWHWKAEMIRAEAYRRGRPELYEEERAVVEAERAAAMGEEAVATA